MIFGLNVFAETYTVLIPYGAASPDFCETNKCVIPDELFIQVGDGVESYVESSYGRFTGCNQGSGNWINFETKKGLTGEFSEKGTYEFVCMVNPWITLTVYVGDSRVDTPESVEQYQKQLEEEKKAKLAAIVSAQIIEDNKPENIIKRYNLLLENKDKQIVELESVIDKKKDIILDLKFKVRDLQKEVTNLKSIVMDQIKVIMDTFQELKNSSSSVT